MITSSLSKMRKSGETIIYFPNFLFFIVLDQVFVWRERLPKISELSKSLAAQHVDNLYLKTLCELTAVISALVYKCT